MKIKVPSLLVVVFCCVVWSSATSYANHGAFDTQLVVQVSATGQRSFEPLFSVGGKVTFTFSTEEGTPFRPSPTCAGVELEGWRIRTLSGEPLTPLVHFSGPNRCVELFKSVQWTWNTRRQNGVFARAGTYLAELVTAGTPTHDGIYGTVFRLVNQPDLVVGGLSLGLTASGAQQIQIDVSNLSSMRARPVEVGFLNSCEGARIGTQTIRFLGAHEVESVRLELAQPLAKNCLRVEVDPQNQIIETNEDNNCLSPPCGFFTHEPVPEPVLSFGISTPLPMGTISAVPLQISWADTFEFFRNGLSSYKLVILASNVEILGVDFVAFKGTAKVARNKRSVTLAAKDTKNSVAQGDLGAVLAQIRVRALSSANASLQIQVLQLIDDHKQFSKYVLRDSQFTPLMNQNNLLNPSLVYFELSASSVQFVPTKYEDFTKVRVAVFDPTGRNCFDSGLVRLAALENFPWGLETAASRSVASGVYFYVVTAYRSDGTVKTEIAKLVILK